MLHTSLHRAPPLLALLFTMHAVTYLGYMLQYSSWSAVLSRMAHDTLVLRLDSNSAVCLVMAILHKSAVTARCWYTSQYCKVSVFAEQHQTSSLMCTYWANQSSLYSPRAAVSVSLLSSAINRWQTVNVTVIFGLISGDALSAPANENLPTIINYDEKSDLILASLLVGGFNALTAVTLTTAGVEYWSSFTTAGVEQSRILT
eukprot:3971-Heterococcus_DN1.PRE.3